MAQIEIQSIPIVTTDATPASSLQERLQLFQRLISTSSQNVATAVLERPTTKRKISSAAGMRRYLRVEHGFEFVPKTRVVTIPKKEFEEQSGYAHYLRRRAGIDTFGPDHSGRSRWHKNEASKVDGRLFNRVCVEENQLTGNSITGVLLNAMYLQRRYSNNPDLAQELQVQFEKLDETYRGTPPTDEMLMQHMLVEQTRTDRWQYGTDLLKDATNRYARERYRLLPVDKKIEIIHEFCTHIVESLWIIARHTNPSPESVKIHVTGKRRTNTSHTL